MSTLQTLTKAIYLILAIVYLAAGASAILYDANVLPIVAKNFIAREIGGDSNTLHLMQEFGALLVFAGLISLWFIWHFDQSQPFHWAMAIFWGLIALVHWFDVRGTAGPNTYRIITTIPFAVFVLIGLLRMATEGDENARR